MPAVHAKIVRLSAKHFAELVKEIKLDLYTPKKREGFLIVEATPSRLRAKYFFPKTQKVKFTDPESLEPQVEEHSVLATCSFTLLPSKGLIWCHERRADFAALEDALGQYQGVAIEFEDLKADCIAVYRELRDTQDRFDLRALRIREYLGKDGLLTTANFKLMEPGAEDKVIKAYGGNITGFTGQTMTDDGRQTITVSEKGSVRYSDGIGEDVVELTLGLLKQHHEEVEVETVAI